MGYRSWAAGLAALAHATLLAAPATFAQDPPSQPAPVGQNKASFARQAIKWSQHRLSELDATISVLEQDAAKLGADARSQAEAALKKLRETRDTYRAKVEEAAANAGTWTDAQVAEARKSLDETWIAFDTQRDNYLDVIKADLATRRAVLEAELDARQKAWQKSIDELRTEAGKLTAKQRADIEARIAALKTQADDARVRIGRLQDASSEAWETMKKSYANAQRLFSDTYVSIRSSIENAAKNDQTEDKK